MIRLAAIKNGGRDIQIFDRKSAKPCGCHPDRDQSLANYSSAWSVALPFFWQALQGAG